MFSSSLCCDRSRLQERFNLITFTSISGSVRDFAGALVPPTQEMLEKAEDWVDGLKASSCAAGRGNTLDALRLALAYRHTDAVVLATGGSDPRSRIDARSAGPTPGFVLQGVRALNVNGAAVHVVALDTPAEDAASQLAAKAPEFIMFSVHVAFSPLSW